MSLELVKADVSAADMESVKASIPDFAKDVRLNFGAILGEDATPDLTRAQQLGTALSCAYAVRNAELMVALERLAIAEGQEALLAPAKAAASIMAMNNVYYRFVHLVHDEEISKLPAKLRMNVIANPGIAKTDFELMALAVSAINGCGMCMESHVQELAKHGVSKLAMQSAVRIAAVLASVSQSLALAA